MTDKLVLPTRTENKLIEERGERRDVQVEDRPFRLLKNQFIEHKGIYDDVEAPLSDMEILLAGGLEVFFNSDSEREAENWPWTGEDKRKKKAAKKAPAKKKAGKKAAKKK